MTAGVQEQSSAYDVVLDAVKAHHRRGTPAHVVRRALTDMAADDQAPVISRAVDEVYGA